VTDWSAWSRDAVALMQRRNRDWRDEFALSNEPFHWDLDSATIRFRRASDEIVASLVLVGTTSEHEGTFLWAWANETIPDAATRGLDAVRRFGKDNDLPLLTDAEFPGSRPDALEVLAIAGRILDADGVFIDSTGDVTCFFALKDFRIERPS
jgi:hypothetical protein